MLLGEGYQAIVDCRPGWGGARSMITRKITEDGWKAEGLPSSMTAEDGRDYESLDARWRESKS